MHPVWTEVVVQNLPNWILFKGYYILENQLLQTSFRFVLFIVVRALNSKHPLMPLQLPPNWFLPSTLALLPSILYVAPEYLSVL